MTDPRQIPRVPAPTARRVHVRALMTSGPGLAWLILFLGLPLMGILAISFCTRGTYGEIEGRFTLANFARFLGITSTGFDPLFLRVLFRSLGMAGATVFISVLFGLPLAFFIAALPARLKGLALMGVVIPFWTNLLIRTYAWQIILSGTGAFARLAGLLGWIAPGEALFPGPGSVLLVLACDYLPMLVLPLYASVEKIEWSIAEAASDLGAGRWGIFRHALLPQIRPGLMAGILLVFIAATGQFVIPDLMGGAKTVLLGSAIQHQFGFSRDWPFGSAMACVAMAFVFLGMWIFARTTGEEGRKALV